ncbi:unnamed protein product [Auanema sp. JU1783]|nr:unnamed protein product [Auanema sp. JU1783]
MFLLVQLLFLFYFIKSIKSIDCFQCVGDYEGLRCTQPCKGEVCVIWKWKTKSELLLQQGCLTGVERRFTARIGCRTNTLGATLCVCNDGDLCNRIERTENAIRSLPAISTPNVECSSRITGTDLYASKKINVCNSNYCHMMKTEIFYDSMAPDVISVYNCADVAEFDFDVRLKNSVNFPGLYPNGCYKIQIQPNEATTDCTCSKNNCNTGIPVVSSGPVRCYVGDNFENDSTIDEGMYCNGDYCFLQKMNDKYVKGCLSVNERNTWSHIKIGYRHIVGTDQWLCQSHLCNMDFHKWNRSITPLLSPLSYRSNHSMKCLSLSLLFIILFIFYN